MNYETERLILREWKDTDLVPFSKMNADPLVMEFMPALLTIEESQQMVARIKERFKLSGFGLWAVETKRDQNFIGYVGLSVPRFETTFTPCVEIAWRLDKSYWGKGIASEGAKKALEIGFNKFDLEEIVSFTVPKNLRSISVMKKIGMIRNAAEDFDHPKLADNSPLKKHVLYRMKKEEWKKICQ